jgi:hypothetical protein
MYYSKGGPIQEMVAALLVIPFTRNLYNCLLVDDFVVAAGARVRSEFFSAALHHPRAVSSYKYEFPTRAVDKPQNAH